MSKCPVLTSILLLLLILATDLTISSEETFNKAIYQSLGSGYSYSYLLTPSTNAFSLCINVGQCALAALDNQAEFFSYVPSTLHCKSYLPGSIVTARKDNQIYERCFFRYRKWIKAYAISIGANSSVYNSFVNEGDPSTWNVEKCSGKFCPNFFRHPILDAWKQHEIEQVKLVLYNNKTVVLDLKFDGQNTTIENWFSRENLCSPWVDIYQAVSFSLSGFKNRRFYMAKPKGCLTDKGWLLICEGVEIDCDWTISPHYPLIFYSNTDSNVLWSSGGHGMADSLAVFIRLKPDKHLT